MRTDAARVPAARPRTAAVVAAGGHGSRLGAAVPKQLLDLGGRTMLEWSVAALARSPCIDEVVVVLPADLSASPPEWIRTAGRPVRVVAGGARRQDSVAAGVAALSADVEIVLIHDAARPFVSEALIAATVKAAVESGAAIAALAARDTVKLAVCADRWGAGGGAGGARTPADSRAEVRPGPQRVGSGSELPGPRGGGRVQERADAGAVPGAPHPGSGGGEVLLIGGTVPREQVYLAQTPQAFRREVIAAAIAAGAGGPEATDESALAERAGFPVRIVEGDPANVKITTMDDLEQARAKFAGREDEVAGMRVGIGYDLHRLVPGRPLVLGGVTIPFELGLAGHSDADVLAHAVTDAVLGAAAAGDIGRHFPDTDERWRGASSLDLLAKAAAVARDAGFVVVNVDAVVIAERPKLAPYIDRMRERLAAALGVAPDAVSVKGKTNEGVGELGRGEAIAVHAVAMGVQGRERGSGVRIQESGASPVLIRTGDRG